MHNTERQTKTMIDAQETRLYARKSVYWEISLNLPDGEQISTLQERQQGRRTGERGAEGEKGEREREREREIDTGGCNKLGAVANAKNFDL